MRRDFFFFLVHLLWICIRIPRFVRYDFNLHNTENMICFLYKDNCEGARKTIHELCFDRRNPKYHSIYSSYSFFQKLMHELITNHNILCTIKKADNCIAYYCKLLEICKNTLLFNNFFGSNSQFDFLMWPYIKQRKWLF